MEGDHVHGDDWKFLKRHSLFVSNKLRVNDSFLHVLYGRGVIDGSEFSYLRTLPNSERNFQLVVEILPRRPESDKHIFAAALEISNQKHIAEKLGISCSPNGPSMGEFVDAPLTSQSVLIGHQQREEYLGTDTLNEDVEERRTARFSRQELIYDDSCRVDSYDCHHDRDFVGSGSFSAVYKGKLVGKDEVVAVKVVDPGEARAFRTEVAILERIQGSQYVIKLLGVCEGARYRALVLEYAPNGDLDSFLSRCTDSEDAGVELQHCKDWNFRLCLISQIALGLQFLHKQDILHRDLKSRNVFLDKEYNCKIGDFNLSRDACEGMGDSSDLSKISQTGTLWFRAPESFFYAVNNSPIDEKKYDCYGFGMIVYHVKEMKLPDCGEEGHSSVIEELINCGWRPPLTRDDGCPTVMLDLIKHCCNVSPENRLGCDEIVQALMPVSGIDSGAQDLSTEMSCEPMSVKEETDHPTSMTSESNEECCSAGIQNTDAKGYSAKLLFNWQLLQEMDVQQIAQMIPTLDSNCVSADAVLLHIQKQEKEEFEVFEVALRDCQPDLYEKLQLPPKEFIDAIVGGQTL